MGIEPTSSAWKAEVLPLNYTRLIPNPSTCYRQDKPCSRSLNMVEGGGFTPGILPFALRAAAPRAAFKIAPGDFVNLPPVQISPCISRG
jgi:hypothetical protein